MSKQKKVWWKSRIIWLNVGAGGVAFLAGAWSEIGSHIPKWLAYGAGTLVAAANVGLRFVTTDALITKRINKEDGNDDPR